MSRVRVPVSATSTVYITDSIGGVPGVLLLRHHAIERPRMNEIEVHRCLAVTVFVQCRFLLLNDTVLLFSYISLVLVLVVGSEIVLVLVK